MKTNNRFITVLLILIFLFSGITKAQQKPTAAERLAWWHEVKFGMFIHWGVYSMYGGIYKGHQQARGDVAWIENRCKIAVAEYRENAKQFNPVNYDPDAWAKMA